MLTRALLTLPLAELQAERTACLQALIALAKGEKVQRVDSNGRSISYGPADLKRLEALISDLDSAIAQKERGGIPARRPILPVY
jgi:hypothetical protein